MNHDKKDSAVKVKKTAIIRAQDGVLKTTNRRENGNDESEKVFKADTSIIKTIILDSKITANIEIHMILIDNFYQVGQILNSNDRYNDEYLQRFADDLRNYGNNYSYEQLTRMKKLANFFDKKELVLNHIYDLDWTKIATILDLSDSKEETIWFLKQTYHRKWTADEIRRNFHQHCFKE